LKPFTGELAARLHGSGGDEFIVVCPSVDDAGVVVRAKELEQTLATVVLPSAIAALYGGASVGHAVRRDGEQPIQLVERAAGLMREQKRLRKGRSLVSRA
jgi:predicted signal transduction protein with EAL and GGDEF domain